MERKYPLYHDNIFQVLNFFKRLEKISSGPSEEKLNKFLKFLTGPLKIIFQKLYHSIKDWIKFAFFGKMAYHPHNSDLIEAMLDKWRNSNTLA